MRTALRLRASRPEVTTPLAELEIAVPFDQRPCNELAQLKGAWLYSWATLPQADYVKRLALLFGFFATTVGGPISFVTFDPLKDVRILSWSTYVSLGGWPACRWVSG